MTGNGAPEKEETMSLVQHLEEFRRVIIISLLAIGIASIVSFFFIEQILKIITRPLDAQGIKLVYTAITEGIFVKFKIALIAGAIFAAPVVLWQGWRFVVPALYPHEKRYLCRLLPASVILFVAGVVFAYFAVFPVAIYVLINLASEFDPMLTISRYLSFTMTFLIPFGLIFELPLVVYFLTKVGVVTPEWLIRNRKYAVVVTFILAAMLTPGPDPLSQLIMAAPILVLYEVGIIVAKTVARKKNAKFNELAGEEG